MWACNRRSAIRACVLLVGIAGAQDIAAERRDAVVKAAMDYVLEKTTTGFTAALRLLPAGDTTGAQQPVTDALCLPVWLLYNYRSPSLCKPARPPPFHARRGDAVKLRWRTDGWYGRDSPPLGCRSRPDSLGIQTHERGAEQLRSASKLLRRGALAALPRPCPCAY